LRHKLPKALSGEEAIKMMQEREDRKAAEEEAKKQRKIERERKKKEREEEKEHKKREKEEKKKAKPKKQRRKRKVSSSSSEISEVVPYMDNDSDDFEESFIDVCPVCNMVRAPDDDQSLWLQCQSCCKWWHVICAGYTQSEIDTDFVFVCNHCD
jgi:ATP-dependent 26S proteasome regulatory subunit